MTKVSNADRIIFPEAGITKGEVVDYYDLVAQAMIFHVEDRPLTLQRFPRGIHEKGFMQKNAAAHFPDTIGRFEAPKKGGTTVYPVLHETGDIPYLANQGTITFHVWTSRIEKPGNADRIVFDLDPEAGDIAAARNAALVVRELFDALGISSTPVATGSKGYHVVAPIAPTVPPDRLASALHGAAFLLAAQHPGTLTTEFRKEKRRGRVFLDWMRNTPGATAVAPWSLRPRPGAPVAVPINWDELSSFAPDAITLRTIGDRLSAGDPVADLAADLPDATAAIESLEELLAAEEIDPKPFDRFRS